MFVLCCSLPPSSVVPPPLLLRFVAQRPREPAHWERIAAVARAVSVPVIANGDVFATEDWARIRDATGAASAMAARGAMWCVRMRFCAAARYLDLSMSWRPLSSPVCQCSAAVTLKCALFRCSFLNSSQERIDL